MPRSLGSSRSVRPSKPCKLHLHAHPPWTKKRGRAKIFFAWNGKKSRAGPGRREVGRGTQGDVIGRAVLNPFPRPILIASPPLLSPHMEEAGCAHDSP